MALAATLIAVTSTAHAQGINLAWNNCIGQSNAAANIQYACDGSRNGGPFRLVASFISPADLHEFVAIQLVIDLAGDCCYSDGYPPQPPMTDWWRLGVGECRDGNIVFPASLAGVGTGTSGVCRNPWLGASTGGGYAYTYLDPNRPRIITAFARDTPTTLASGQHYVAGVIALDTFGDVASEGIAACAGCCEKRAFILQQIELYQEPGQIPPQQDLFILNMAGTRQHVFWQDNPALCATPTRKATWGSIKATYR